MDLRTVKAHITDARALAAVESWALCVYLNTHGWRWADSSVRSDEYEADGAHCVTMPKEQGWPDYSLRIGEAITTLAAVEDRSELAVLADIMAIQNGEQPDDAAEQPATRERAPMSSGHQIAPLHCGVCGELLEWKAAEPMDAWRGCIYVKPCQRCGDAKQPATPPAEEPCRHCVAYEEAIHTLYRICHTMEELQPAYRGGLCSAWEILELAREIDNKLEATK